MPKNPLKFTRRKSSGNALEEVSAPISSEPATSSFRVLQRPEKINLNAAPQQVRPVQRPFNSPLQSLRGKSAEELGVNRGSGGTTNSGSSGYYDSSSASARHSSTSTLPSSVDAEHHREEEELFPVRKARTSPMNNGVSSAAEPPPSSFSTRAARAFSFGQKHNRNVSAQDNVPPLPAPPVRVMTGGPKPQERPRSPYRERALTTSSYASTAKPEVNLDLGMSDFGSDFGNMFDGMKSKRNSSQVPPVPPVAAFHRTESEPLYPPRTHSRNDFKSSRENLDVIRDESNSPYSWDRKNSNDGLMSGSPMGSPSLDGPPVPAHTSGMARAFLGKPKDGYSLVPERSSPNPDRFSNDTQPRFMTPNGAENGDEYDSQQSSPNEEKFAKRTNLRSQQDSESLSSTSSGSEVIKIQTRIPSGYPSQATAGASRAGGFSTESLEDDSSLWASESRNATPRAAKVELTHLQEESLFDSSPLGPPSRAVRPQHSRNESDTPKKMTRQQFERLQRGSGASSEHDEEDDQLEDELDDDDDKLRAKELSKQRQINEANMSVYRQQMKKVTGGGPGDLPSMTRPSIDRAPASAPAVTAPGGTIHFGGIGGRPPSESVRGKQAEDDDEDVPLGILQAHGFPSPGRPPTRSGDNDTTQRRMSTTGSVMGGGGGQGNLPPFARRLPADPYFGSSVVNPTQRESLNMTGAPSIHGGHPQMPQMMPQPQMMGQQVMAQPQMGNPGGLVGVIAGEERAKAARRGSPNTTTGPFTGQMGQMPLPVNMPQMGGMPGMPGMPRTMSMGSMMPAHTYMPSGMGTNGMMPQMPQMPMQQPQQQDSMQQFMQMQMQLMQNMLQMQQQQMGQTPPPQPQQPQQQPRDYLGVQLPGNRRGSVASGAPSVRSQAPTMGQGRSMTMLNPPTRWDVAPQQGRRPNSAMPQMGPSTYAPSGMNGIGPEAGYTPSIAPTERSNIGMASRYRPVTVGNDGTGRSKTMTSSSMLPAFLNRKPSPDPPRPQSQYHPNGTVRLLDKPKGAPKALPKPPANDDEDDGWADMKKKRDDKKKFRFGKKNKDESALGDLYQSMD